MFLCCQSPCVPRRWGVPCEGLESQELTPIGSVPLGGAIGSQPSSPPFSCHFGGRQRTTIAVDDWPISPRGPFAAFPSADSPFLFFHRTSDGALGGQGRLSGIASRQPAACQAAEFP